MRVGECLQRPQQLIAGPRNRDNHFVFYLSYVRIFLHMKDVVSTSFQTGEGPLPFYLIVGVP
jgi:hypothetical protein